MKRHSSDGNGALFASRLPNDHLRLANGVGSAASRRPGSEPSAARTTVPGSITCRAWIEAPGALVMAGTAPVARAVVAK